MVDATIDEEELRMVSIYLDKHYEVSPQNIGRATLQLQTRD